MRKTGGKFMSAVLAGSLGLAIAMTVASAVATAQSGTAKQTDEAAIRAVIATQAEAWNRGDIQGFMTSYEDSPETTFVGTTSINKGFRPILERYKQGYANHAQMGTLSFKDLEIRLLPSASGVYEYAVATGRFHLERAVKGTATKDDGIFSLVWHKGKDGWQIVLNHTS
jgi:uncharacterized protein (TIGR02246 family)